MPMVDEVTVILRQTLRRLREPFNCLTGKYIKIVDIYYIFSSYYYCVIILC